MARSVVLVTGGSGFLGQHVIKHLQLYTPHLREIRVLDIVSFVKRLDYNETVPVKSFVGSVTDVALVNQACQGVECVFHVASLVDTRLFPNDDAMHEINVKGTKVILDACKTNSVPNLIYCSSISVCVGTEEVKEGTELSVKLPNKFLFKEYAASKLKAQEIVIHANGDILRNGKELRTCAILPLPMYGELDTYMVYTYVTSMRGRRIKKIPKLGKMEAHIQISYVGNVAMMFIRAYEVFRNGGNIGGECFYGADDTPVQTMPNILKPFLEALGISFFSWYIPLWVMVVFVFLVYWILIIIRPIKKVNMPLNIEGIHYLNKTFYVTYEKAKRILGYKPIYDMHSALQNSLPYYSRAFLT